jgi:phage baseplate assembly protein W
MAITETAISLPFTITPYGTVGTTTDQSKIWSDRVLSVIGTSVGERVMNYGFGSRLHNEVHNNQTAASEMIRSEIYSAFMRFLPLLTLESVETQYISEDNALKVEVNYKLPNDTSASVTVGSVSLNGNNQISEVI